MSSPAVTFPLMDFLGMSVGRIGPGRSEARLTLSGTHLNPNGVVHGAVLFTMVDTAMGEATMSTLAEGQLCASVEVHLRFVRPASQGSLVARASVVKAGRAVVHLSAEVHDDQDRLIATATGTFVRVS